MSMKNDESKSESNQSKISNGSKELPVLDQDSDSDSDSETETSGSPGSSTKAHKDGSIVLELGDIIEIEAASNPELHQNTFFILYLDDSIIRLANISTFHAAELRLDEDGRITDESITKIILQSRSYEHGYARQHRLLPKTWVDIHFGGEVPTIITGEITNLEEDMIEITTYPDLETIYIDFEYKGIPENMSLTQIVIRTKPASLDKIESLTRIKESGDGSEDDVSLEMLSQSEEASMEFLETGESLITISKGAVADKTVREHLQTLYLAANEIIYGEELEELVQRVEIPEWKKRYGIDTQVNDLMDELLSDIPNSRRTKYVLDNIHLLIERFRELRKAFSRFDDQGNVLDVRTVGSFHKPLVQHMMALDRGLKWILPVVADKRKIYTSEHPESIVDVVQLDNREALNDDVSKVDDYYKNRMRGDVPAYSALYSSLHPSFVPVEPPMLVEDYLAPETEIHAPIESILSGLEDFYSTTAGKKDGYAKRRFVVQRYNLGETKQVAKASATTGRRVYVREPMTPNDSLTVKSVFTLPESAIHFSRINLPGTSILDRAALSQTYMCLFRLLFKRTNVHQHLIRKFGKDMDQALWEEGDGRGPLWAKQFREFTLDDSLAHDPNRFREFLKTIVPKTSTLIDILQKRKYRYNTPMIDPSIFSVKRMTDTLEPFLVYINDLTYTQYNQIRYYVKTQLKDHKKLTSNREKEMDTLRIAKYGVQEEKQMLMRLFSEKREFLDLIMDAYRLKPTENPESTRKPRDLSAHEWLTAMIRADSGQLLATILQYMMISLITPENMVAALDKGEHDEMSKGEKIKARDCAQRVLSKRYSSIRDMQKDNADPDVFFDSEFDDTPYDLLKKYKEEQKKYSPEEFADFLQEALVQKHDCPKHLAPSLAQDLIAGKKRVKEGEYAIVELTPHLKDGSDLSDLSIKEQKEVAMEADAKKRIQYYRRKRNQWSHDPSIDDESFIDTNTLFCNMDKICFRNTRTTAPRCEPMGSAEQRMREIAQKRMLQEFGNRMTTSIEGLQDSLKAQITVKMRNMMSTFRLQDLQMFKYNVLAYELGKMSKKENLIQSPYIGLRDQILGQDSFVDRQNNIVRFADLYCRGAMVDELSEKFHWLYCQDTNVPLLPTFLLELAHTFISGGDYPRKQNEICRSQGQLSDDGDSYVDRHSGYVIKKIDFVEEDGYDESGFKLITHGLIEKDAGEALAEVFAANQQSLIQTSTAGLKKDRVFENETAEMVYKVFSAISTNIGLDLEAVEDFVMRLSMDLIQKNITSEKAYGIMSAKMEKDKGKRPPPYAIYKNQTILIMVATVVLVSVQTACPSFKIRKTFPGCVQSFGGYPSTHATNGLSLGKGEESGGSGNLSGINYIACVLNKTKSSIPPWDSIKKIPLTILQDRIKKVVDTLIITRTDIMELYERKQEYLLLHPEQEVPKDLDVIRWTGFMPPLVKYSVKRSAKGLSNEYKNDLITSMRNGNREQRSQIGVFKVKVVLYSYEVMESIRDIVASKELLLKTASNLYFNENACCNDRNTAKAMDYFAMEESTIVPHLKMIHSWVSVLDNLRELSRPSILFHPFKTGIQRMDLPVEHYEENIYGAFIHYCNLDRDLPIPHEMRALISEKPADYNVRLPIADKIELLKSQGKRFTLMHLNQLMAIVNKRNLVNISSSIALKGTRTSGLVDFLNYMDTQDAALCEKPLCKLLQRVIGEFNPKAMVLEDSESTRHLNNYLTRANEEMLTAVSDFFQMYGNLNARKFAGLTKMLSEIHIWTMEQESGEQKESKVNSTMFNVVQFLRTSVDNMSRMYPEMICNNHSPVDDVEKKWGLSENHSSDLGQSIKKHYEPLQKFRGDSIIIGLLQDSKVRLADLTTFLTHIPTFAPIVRKVAVEDKEEPVDAVFYSLFSRRTLYMLHTYTWYSVLYEYILKTEDEDLLQMDVQERKSMRRRANREKSDAFLPGGTQEGVGLDEEEGDEDAIADEQDDRAEIQIQVGNQRELKLRVAELLLAFLDVEEKNKRDVDMSYKDIDASIRRSKLQEKKMITDFLRNMDPDQRRVEDELKKAKLGRWNVGMQKGLVHYDKDTYDRERNELFLQLNDPTAAFDNMEAMITTRGVEDLEADMEAEADAAADQEAYDIGGLGEEYGNGRYYDDDVDEEQEDGFGYE